MLKTAREEIILPSLHELISILKNMAHEYANQIHVWQGSTCITCITHNGWKRNGKCNCAIRTSSQTTQSGYRFLALNGATGNFNAFVVNVSRISIGKKSLENFISKLGFILESLHNTN